MADMNTDATKEYDQKHGTYKESWAPSPPSSPGGVGTPTMPANGPGLAGPVNPSPFKNLK